VFKGETHVSNAVISGNAPGLGYSSVKPDELINSASPLGNDEQFVSGFPRRRPVASHYLHFWTSLAKAMRSAFEAHQPLPGLDRGPDLLSTRKPRVANDTQAVEERDMIRGLFLAAMIATFAAGTAMAQETCESKAVGKDGKALAGAAKTSFMKKCMADSCATKAVSADGKPLSGAAKNSFMAKCEKGS
jgi:hypothetical protein